MSKLLNLGCGIRYHKEWVNIDFHSNSEDVISHDLLQGIPFQDNKFDVVYHSHLLEHFTRKQALDFIRECYRVLKVGGTIRIAVPDLEQIAREYLKNFEKASDGNKNAALNYEWIMLELYDQTVRSTSGGDMAEYLSREFIKNEEFVFSRIGEEGKRIREFLTKDNKTTQEKNSFKIFKHLFSFSSYKTLFLKLFFNKEYKLIEIGSFRKGGEIHQWMYDCYSLSDILKNVNFKDIKIMSAETSRIPLWKVYNLDSKDGVVFRPDSLFIEAVK